MKLLINKENGGFYLADEANGYLIAKGYSSEEVSNIMCGRCPRDLPILHECFKLFGGWRYSEIEEVECPDGLYYIENYDGQESVITEKNMHHPNESLEEYLKREYGGGNSVGE